MVSLNSFFMLAVSLSRPCFKSANDCAASPSRFRASVSDSLALSSISVRVSTIALESMLCARNSNCSSVCALLEECLDLAALFGRHERGLHDLAETCDDRSERVPFLLAHTATAELHEREALFQRRGGASQLSDCRQKLPFGLFEAFVFLLAERRRGAQFAFGVTDFRREVLDRRGGRYDASLCVRDRSAERLDLFLGVLDGVVLLDRLVVAELSVLLEILGGHVQLLLHLPSHFVDHRDDFLNGADLP